VKELAKKFKEEKFLVSNTPGYNSFFLVAGGDELKTEEDEMEIEGKVTSSKLTKAFMKMNKKKQISRVLVSKFIQGIAA
jgi:UDP-2,3-diacylglucosamine pyrophosphatase LpxH